jgi:hypothetical protein
MQLAYIRQALEFILFLTTRKKSQLTVIDHFRFSFFNIKNKSKRMLSQ